MKNKIKEYLLINFGLLLVAVPIYFILAPNSLAPGGISGLAIIINHFLPKVPVGALMMAIDLVLFIIGVIFIGFGFGAKTIYSSFTLSGMVIILQKINPVPKPFSHDILTQLIFGTCMSAVGMAIVFQQNACTGGTDIIAKILNKYFHINLGKGVLICDIGIAIFSGVIFGIESAMYGVLGVLFSGITIDKVIQSLTINKEVVIISNRSVQIKQYVVSEIERGATIYVAKGAFTNEEKEVIRTIVTKKEFSKLRKYIKTVDENAFITVNHIHETFGEGFLNIR
ncbi:YitT family protein [Clostridium rectalis]|uniref:YitT family protein n=1 Tax=Clostridium rectalis TaxID=2040295 RepID=UPI000F6420A9|nr:YitT family protein [Clostridium rectalis]